MNNRAEHYMSRLQLDRSHICRLLSRYTACCAAGPNTAFHICSWIKIGPKRILTKQLLCPVLLMILFNSIETRAALFTGQSRYRISIGTPCLTNMTTLKSLLYIHEL
jgi:hypothetical protein